MSSDGELCNPKKQGASEELFDPAVADVELQLQADVAALLDSNLWHRVSDLIISASKEEQVAKTQRNKQVGWRV